MQPGKLGPNKAPPADRSIAVGDHVFYRDKRGRHYCGEVKSSGKDGFCAKAGDKLHRVPHSQYVGHKTRRKREAVIEHEGEDGRLARLDCGTVVFMPRPAEPDPEPEDEKMTKSVVLPLIFTKAMEVSDGGPGLGRDESQPYVARERECWPSGYLKPVAGDRVFQSVPGFSRAVIVSGRVYATDAGKLRVRITSVSGPVTSEQAIGQTVPLTEMWRCFGDYKAMGDVQGRRDPDRVQRAADAQAAFMEATAQAAMNAKATDGHRPIDPATIDPGARICGWDGGNRADYVVAAVDDWAIQLYEVGAPERWVGKGKGRTRLVDYSIPIGTPEDRQVAMERFTVPHGELGKALRGLVLFAKAGPVANRPGLALQDVQTKAGKQTKRWVRTDKPMQKPDYGARQHGESDKAYAKRAIDTREAPKHLPEEHHKYFETEGSKKVPLDRLHSSKSDSENEKGGDNGAKRMEAAYHGVLGRRKPITVMPHKDKDGHYEIVDGNGTYTSVKKYGWKHLPVSVVDRESGEKMIAEDKAKDAAKAKEKASTLMGQRTGDQAEVGEHVAYTANGQRKAGRVVSKGKDGMVLEGPRGVKEKIPLSALSDGHAFSPDRYGSSKLSDDEINNLHKHVGETAEDRKANQLHDGVEDEASAYASAAQAQKQFEDLASKTGGLADKLGAQLFIADQGGFEKYMLENPDKPVITIAPIKGKGRASEKASKEVDGWAAIRDLVRGSIVVPTLNDVPKALKAIKDAGYDVVRAKNRFREDKKLPTGYRDILLNVRMPNGHVAELQVHTHAMLEAKSKYGGHGHYDVSRVYDDKIKGNQQLTPDEAKEHAHAVGFQQQLYGRAWSSMTGRPPPD